MIVAGVTLFQPEIERLKENINAIYPQVDRVFCVDNGSNNIDEVENWLNVYYSDIILVKNTENLGIARALNQIFEYAVKQDAEWVLTLDQDSVCPSNLIQIYRDYMNVEKIGIICPVLRDRNYEQMDETKGKSEQVSECITSASLNSVSAWTEVGGFFEPLFIDYVDQDYCANLIEHGYHIIRANEAILLHEIGQGENHQFLGKRVTALNHSAFRKYYMARNSLYYMWAHKKTINYNREKAKYYFLYIKTLLYENHKCEKIKAMFRGRRDWKKLKQMR